MEASRKPLVTIGDKGVLTAQDTLGQSVVSITSTDKQMLTLSIQVKPIHYMLLNPRPNWSPETPINVIPLGSEFDLVTSYHDDQGAEFTAADPEVVLRNTRWELVKVHAGSNNATMLIETRKSGTGVLEASASKLRQLVDYIILHVDNVRSPSVEVSRKKKLDFTLLSSMF